MTKAELVNNIAIQTGYDKVTPLIFIFARVSVSLPRFATAACLAFLCRAPLRGVRPQCH